MEDPYRCIGFDDFREIVEKKAFFIDKTMFISDYMRNGCEVSVFLRPRGFGKSTNLSMLKNFYSLGADFSLFQNKAISKDEKFCETHFGKYPVVHLKFSAIKSSSWEEMRNSLWGCFCEVARLHFEDIKDDKFFLSCFDIYSPTPPNFFSDFLLDLMETLHEKHGQRVILLIDDYYNPLNDAFQKGFYEEASTFFQKFFSSSLKDNRDLESACLVGAAEIDGKGLPSMANNVCCLSVSVNICCKYFGFTSEEIRPYCADEDEFSSVLEWYGGYSVGDHKMISPSSFCHWLRTKTFSNYWTEIAGSNALADDILDNGEEAFFGGYELAFFNSETYIRCFSVSFWIIPSKRCDIWKKYVNLGYLSYDPLNEDSSEEGCATIPNLELKKYWQTSIMTAFETIIAPISRSNVAQSLQDFNTDQLRTVMEHMITAFSFNRHAYETSYHKACLYALQLVFLNQPDVKVVSNCKEERYVVAVHFHTAKKIVMIEFLRSKSEDQIEKEARRALHNIKENAFSVEYKDHSCLLIGISFHGNQMSEFETEIL